jgi:hypothetical protein
LFCSFKRRGRYAALIAKTVDLAAFRQGARKSWTSSLKPAFADIVAMFRIAQSPRQLAEIPVCLRLGAMSDVSGRRVLGFYLKASIGVG